MEILLKKDVANLGYAGEIVKVKAGYAMNYLVPQGFATVATESVKKQHAETLRQRASVSARTRRPSSSPTPRPSPPPSTRRFSRSPRRSVRPASSMVP